MVESPNELGDSQLLEASDESNDAADGVGHAQRPQSAWAVHLPKEILLLILDKQDDPEVNSRESIHSFMVPAMVCRLWRYFLQQDTNYWTSLNIAYPPTIPSFIPQLVSSGRMYERLSPKTATNHFLSITIDMTDYDDQDESHRCALLLAADLIPYAQYTVRLHSYWGVPGPLSGPSPNLDSFLSMIRLNTSAVNFSYHHLNHAETLDDLHLFDDIHLPVVLPPSSPPSSFRWSQLRSLELDCQLSVAFCRDLLMTCGLTLVNLSLNDIAIDEAEEVNQPTGVPTSITLLHLQKMRLGFSTDLVPVFEDINIPNLEELELQWVPESTIFQVSPTGASLNWANLEKFVWRGNATLPIASAMVKAASNLSTLEWFGDCRAPNTTGHWSANFDIQLPMLSTLKVIHNSQNDMPTPFAMLIQTHCTQIEDLCISSVTGLQTLALATLKNLEVTRRVTSVDCLSFMAGAPELRTASVNVYEPDSDRDCSLPYLLSLSDAIESLSVTLHGECSGFVGYWQSRSQLRVRPNYVRCRLCYPGNLCII
ncbi:hypothetical protein FA15DRAFT_281790 [Coprinopsis marcescibilis]|uniref:F-box domain-containing protein n=1 Tax=Coprinopsis marcescibilis TaxID=230819 RepID=A0A5C3L972_COPMA|nr:hypothetical protein FA15DRAFT_281790 [Coprinopsis marcescibilis]